MQTYFALLASLEQAHDQKIAHPNVLVVKAAGNDNAVIDSPEDSIECRPNDPSQLLMGSYDPDEKLSEFTNHGACVDAYAPGEYVIAPLPGDWFFINFGTSFSAPLVTRLLSLNTPAPFNVTSARDTLANFSRANKNIRPGRFPSDLLYDPRSNALTSSMPSMVGNKAISRVDLHRILWPLRWVQSHRR